MTVYPKYPDTIHYKGLNQPTHIEATAHDLYVEGEIPKEVDGAFYRAVHEAAYAPFRDDDVVTSGDGMVSMIAFDKGRVSTGIKYVMTERHKAERAAGKALFGIYRNPYTDDPSVAGVDRTVANTTPYYHGGRLFMSKEDGLPYRINPFTLETMGRWDYNGKLRSETLVAHPKVDPETGEMFIFGYEADGLASTKVSYCIMSPDGELKSEVWFDAPYCALQHDFAISEKHAVFLVYPTIAELDILKAGGQHWIHHQDMPCWIGVMPRYGTADDLTWVKGPDGVSCFHPMNAVTDGNKLHIDQCLFNTNFFPWIQEVSKIDLQPEGGLVRWTLDLDNLSAGIQEETVMGPTCEMPVVRPQDVGRNYKWAWYLTMDPTCMTLMENGPGGALFNCIHRVNIPGGLAESYSVGPTCGINEPVFINSEDPNHGGYLLFMVDRIICEGHWKQEIWIIEAENMSKGPIARVFMPFTTCEQVHGAWVPRKALDQARMD